MLSRLAAPSDPNGPPPARRIRPLLLQTVGFGLAYFACEWFTHAIRGDLSYLLSFWLPSGLFLGVLLWAERRQWGWLFLAAGLGDQAYNYLVSAPWPLDYLLLAHLGNGLSAILGAWLMRRLVAERPTLESMRELIGLTVFGGIVGLLPSATIGAALVTAGSPPASYAGAWISWYCSDLLGVIVLTPALLAWREGIPRPAHWQFGVRELEAVGLLAGLVASTGLAYYFHWPRETETLYVAFPFVIWASLRFGLRGATGIILLTAMLAEWLIAQGYGAVGESTMSPAERNAELLIDLGLFAIVGLLPAIALAAQKRTAAALQTSEQRFRDLFHLGTIPATLLSMPDGRLVDANEAITGLSGYSRQELLGRTALELNLWTDPAERTRYFDLLQRQGRVTGFEGGLRKKNGEMVTVLFNSSLHTFAGQTYALNTLLDITVRKQTEAALRESEERFQLANRAMFNVLWDQNVQTKAIWWNEHLETVYGYRPEEAGRSGAFWRERLHPEDRDRVYQGVQAALNSASVNWSDSYRFRRKDGTYAFVEDRAHILRDQAGKPLRLIGAMQDISERTQAEVSLHESERRFRSHLLSLSAGVVVQDAAARIIFCNPKATTLLGLTEDQLLGKTSFDPDWNVIHEDGTPFPGETHPVPQALATGRPVHNVVMGVHRPVTGDRVWLLVNADPQPSDPPQVICVFHDITKRKRIELRLRASEARLRAIIDHEPECVKVVAPDGTLLEMNPAGLRMIEADSPAQVVNRSVYPLIAEEHRGAFRALHEKVLRGESGELVFDITGLKGTRRTLETHAVPLRDDAGAITSSLGLTRDITARKHSEAEHHRLSKIVEQSLNEIYLFDAENLRFEYVNESAQRNLGYTLDQLRTLTPVDLKPDFDAVSFRALLGPLLRREKGLLVFQTVHRRADGTLYPVEVHLQLTGSPDRRVFLAMILNITDRREAEAQLRLVSQVVEQTADHIIITDAAGIIQYVNPAFERATGYSLAEAVGQTPRLLKSNRHRPEFYATLWETLLQGRVFRAEFYNRRKNGQLFVEDKTITPITDAGGRITHFVSNGRDVTERKQAELRIRELADYLNKAHDAIIVTGLNNRITFWNEGATRLSGWTETEALGKTPEEITGTLPLAQIHAMRETVLRTGAWQGDIWLHGKHGQPLNLAMSVTLIRDATGQPTARLNILTDISESKQAELRIREQAELLNQTHDAIMVAGLDNRFTFWNAGAERITGWAATEALDRTGNELFGPAATARLPVIRDAVMATGIWHGELSIRRKDGRAVVLDLRVSLIRDEAGRPVSRLSIGTDITERKQLEEQVQRTQRLESIGMLSAGIAHDLNNVLSPILMAAPLLRRPASSPAELRTLDTLERCAERGAALVRQILAFSRGTAGEPQVLQPKHLARDIVELIEQTFPKSISVEVCLPDDLWSIRAMPTQFHQVLLNLCINARDAMPQGGTLRLIAGNRRLETVLAAGTDARTGAFVVFEVADTGVGIPPDIIDHIWEPFFTTKAEGQGTGLGLSTVRGIVEQYGGLAEVESELGRGSRFRLYFPALPVASASAGDAAALPRRHGELLLVVDDEAPILDLTTAILGQWGYEVLAATDARAALTLFVTRSADIRLVISDLNMPGFDGPSLATAIRRIRPDIKILFVSGGADGPARASAIPQANFLAKPFKPDALLTRVHQLLSEN